MWNLNDIRKYKQLKMLCPRCNKNMYVDTPINFKNLKCTKCNSNLEAFFWDNGKPIDHSLTKNLIIACYKYNGLAKEIVRFYKREYSKASMEECGIDKWLLIVHAVNSIVNRRKNNKYIIISGIISLLAPVFLVWVPLLIYNYRNKVNLIHIEKYFSDDSYDPVFIEEGNLNLIKKIIKFTDFSQPQNLYFFSNNNPFIQFGNNHTSWSLFIDRRKTIDGEILDEPINFDINKIYFNIIKKIFTMKSKELSKYHYNFNDIVIADPDKVDIEDTNFFKYKDDLYYPKTEISISELEEDSFSYKLYKKVVFYDHKKNICIQSFIRLLNQGSFTYIEVLEAEILEIRKNLSQKFKYGMTYKDFKKSFEKNKINISQILFDNKNILITYLILLLPVLSYLTISPSMYYLSYGSLFFNSNTTITSLVIISFLFIKDCLYITENDLYEEKKDITFPISLLIRFLGVTPNKESIRLKIRRNLKYKQLAKEFDFCNYNSLKKMKSRLEPKNYFELVDKNLIKSAQNIVIQEEFLKFCEENGVDTKEFRKGISQINNYGIINSGNIEGEAKSRFSNITNNYNRKNSFGNRAYNAINKISRGENKK